ncbi:uncharacterized protein BO72DRAFT_297028 [Aspergillus fijiensis CBS 313.89]|uniref:Uncharacterized protein n=1 Tax=Aspergillus fijiensis CBS 313.89 TaxID=1448319 RepID=A0A8G1RJZ6_9EURO|nr:uncharacterized protein BO72DRAFT_297028 [Aspergillus fijiensis CBS 313.89]RAK71856.1 hypothetical protein BO72DRAFT_297028 [Aspergillus fijiensis CBS 313.89]
MQIDTIYHIVVSVSASLATPYDFVWPLFPMLGLSLGSSVPSLSSMYLLHSLIQCYIKDNICLSS